MKNGLPFLALAIAAIGLLLIPVINQRLYAFLFSLLRFLVLFFVHMR